MPTDLERLQGTWFITGLESDGQTMAAETFSEACIVVDGSRFVSKGLGPEYEGTLHLDPAATPARLDLKFDTGPEKGNTNYGIYRLAADSWTLCLATRGTERPAGFATTAGSGFALETLSRSTKAKRRSPKKSAQAPSGGTGPATPFEGEWKLVSAVMDGKPMEESMVQWVKRIGQGNQATVLAGPQTMLKVEFTFDPATSSIDYLCLAGAHKGKRQLGIYQFTGEVVTFCVAPPGAERPAEFSSVLRDGRALTTWRKA